MRLSVYVGKGEKGSRQRCLDLKKPIVFDAEREETGRGDLGRRTCRPILAATLTP